LAEYRARIEALDGSRFQDGGDDSHVPQPRLIWRDRAAG
jgi:hypothetical protein